MMIQEAGELTVWTATRYSPTYHTLSSFIFPLIKTCMNDEHALNCLPSTRHPVLRIRLLPTRPLLVPKSISFQVDRF